MYTVNTLDGVKRRAVYGKSKKEVRLRLTEAIADRDKGLVFDSGNLSVGEYLGRWLEAIQSTIGELTWKRHESIVRLHIAPAIGAIKLAALTPLQVQSLYRAKSKSHLGPRKRQAHPYDTTQGAQASREMADDSPQPL